MTGEEKRRLLKEKYKQDFRQRKEFLKKVEELKRSKKLNEAVQNITSGITEEDSDDWISKLNEETALTEARMEIALDEAKEQQRMLEQLAKEAEMQKIQAKNLVEEMKMAMGVESEEEHQPPAQEEKADTTASESSKEPTEKKVESDDKEDDEPPRFKKTLGDF